MLSVCYCVGVRVYVSVFNVCVCVHKYIFTYIYTHIHIHRLMQGTAGAFGLVHGLQHISHPPNTTHSPIPPQPHAGSSEQGDGVGVSMSGGNDGQGGASLQDKQRELLMQFVQQV